MSAAIFYLALLAFGFIATILNLRIPVLVCAPLFVLAGCAGVTVSDGDVIVCGVYGALLGVLWCMVAREATGRNSCAKP